MHGKACCKYSNRFHSDINTLQLGDCNRRTNTTATSGPLSSLLKSTTNHHAILTALKATHILQPTVITTRHDLVATTTALETDDESDPAAALTGHLSSVHFDPFEQQPQLPLPVQPRHFLRPSNVPSLHERPRWVESSCSPGQPTALV